MDEYPPCFLSGLCFLVSLMVKIQEREFNNILIIKPSAAGDIICALPILAGLRRRYPGARISWMVAKHLQDLLMGHPMIDEVIPFDRKRFGYLGLSWVVTRRFLKFLKSLRSAKYDLVVDLQGLFRSGFFSWASGAKVRIGPGEKREMGWIFYTHRMPARDRNTHIVDRIGAVGELLKIDFSEPEFPIYIHEDARRRVGELLAEQNVEADEFVAIAPGGTWSSKRWAVENFAELAGKIVTELGRRVVLIGGRGEMKLADVIVEKNAGKGVVNFTGLTTLPELLAVIEKAGAVVCNDSGPMHMAAAMGKCVTAIIGPTNAKRTGPYRKEEGVVKTGLACSPCYKKICSKVGKEGTAACLAAVDVEEVFENLRRQMGEK
jgi:heptosyltransferase-1